MSDNECELFEELTKFSKELKEDQDYYGYPYNAHNPRYNLNLISSATLDELIRDIVELLSNAYEYKNNGWELTDPIRFGNIELHYNRDGQPERKGGY